MRSMALKLSAFVAGLGLASAAVASDGAESPVDLWQNDPTAVFDAADVDLQAFQWIARPVIVFADTSADPAFQRQLELLSDRMDELVARDIVLITDTNPTERSALRTQLRPRGFMLTLIGKDGGVKLRKPFPWDVRELTRQVDKMPLRRQEIIDAKNAARDGE